MGGGNTCNTGQLGDCQFGITSCVAGSLVCQQDVFPTAEVCNGIDDDCNGLVDDLFQVGAPCDGPDLDQCAEGVFECFGAGLVCNEAITDIAEVCDGVDNDCDGTVDEDFVGLGSPCGFGQCSGGTEVCSLDGSSTVCSTAGKRCRSGRGRSLDRGGLDPNALNGPRE